MRKFKETKKQFDKVREDLELALVRNAQAPRHRPHEVEEATGALTLTRKCFRHLALDYVLQVGHWAPSERVLEWAGGVSADRWLVSLGVPVAPENLSCQILGRDVVGAGKGLEVGAGPAWGCRLQGWRPGRPC